MIKTYFRLRIKIDKKTFRINFQSLLWIFFPKQLFEWKHKLLFLRNSVKLPHVIFESQCETAKSSFEFHFLHYLCMMLLDDFSVSCKQRLLTLQFENELDGACYSLLAALLLVWSPCSRIFKFNAVYIFFQQIRKPTTDFRAKLITELIH